MLRMVAAALAISIGLHGCGEKEEERNVQTHAILVTTATSSLRDVPVVEEVVGRIQDPDMVILSSEVAAKVIAVHVHAGDTVDEGTILAELDDGDFRAIVREAKAEEARLEAQIRSQRRLVERYRRLVKEKYISQTLLDQAEAQLASLQEVRRAARARRERAERNLLRTQVRSPMRATVQKRGIAKGDYVRPGDPMFVLTSRETLHIVLPFPETEAGRIQPGQKVLLSLPGRAQEVKEGVISKVEPMVDAANAAFQARVDLPQPGDWKPGSSVIAKVVVEIHRKSVLVPEGAIVLRPKGEVVYRIREGKAFEQQITTGIHLDGFVEVLQGLEAGETVAVDGAGFLTNGALVRVAEPQG